jgi:hypothetical protein
MLTFCYVTLNFKISFILMPYHLAHSCLTCRFSYLIISTHLQLCHINNSRCFFPVSQESCSCFKLHLILVASLSLLHLQPCQSHPNTWHHELPSLFIFPSNKGFHAAWSILQQSSKLVFSTGP